MKYYCYGQSIWKWVGAGHVFILIFYVLKFLHSILVVTFYEV